MMLQFEVDGPFSGREDDGNLVFRPGDFVDVGGVLLLD
jgi:hypothetical protein